MGFDKHDHEIDPYAIRLIEYKARMLVGKAGFTASDRDDLEQELILDLLHRLPRYDRNRAQRNTFIARVVEHKIANLIKAQKAGIRDYRRCRCSLNDRFEDEDGRSVERIDTLDQEHSGPHTGTQSRRSDELRMLAIDMGFVLETLPPELRNLCQRLVAETVTEISRSTGVPRGTLYESIKKLRKIFKDAGLKDYL